MISIQRLRLAHIFELIRETNRFLDSSESRVSDRPSGQKPSELISKAKELLSRGRRSSEHFQKDPDEWQSALMKSKRFS